MKKKYKILVIDDDPDILDSMKMILEKNGFAAVTAVSGKDGVEIVKKKKPDLVLCDMMMEKIDSGITVAKAIKRISSKIPIFLISNIGTATAYNVDVDKIGFKGVFQKPVDVDLMITKIKDVLK
ncbi:MAG: response regulator [Spirochaetes bacterium]|nr:response regulator [Spirochaetota bacterium]